MTPHTLLRWSVRTLAVTGPLSLLTLLAWVFQLIPDARPFAVLMAYQLLLLLSVGAACVAALAGVQLAIHQAFSAGFKTGQASTPPRTDPLAERARQRDAGEDGKLLRLVE